MEVLADHFAKNRNSNRTKEMKNIKQSEQTRLVLAKHKWYLKERHGMIRILLVPDFQINEIISVVGMLAITTLMIHATQKTINPPSTKRTPL